MLVVRVFVEGVHLMGVGDLAGLYDCSRGPAVALDNELSR
jgi:hypothetical protein